MGKPAKIPPFSRVRTLLGLAVAVFSGALPSLIGWLIGGVQGAAIGGTLGGLAGYIGTMAVYRITGPPWPRFVRVEDEAAALAESEPNVIYWWPEPTDSREGEESTTINDVLDLVPKVRQWAKRVMGVLVTVVAVFNFIMGCGYLDGLISITDKELAGATAATFAMCAAAMLFLTMYTKDQQAEDRANRVFRIGSVVMAFLSGWFWLVSTLDSTALYIYLGLLIGLAVISVFAATLGSLVVPAASRLIELFRPRE